MFTHGFHDLFFPTSFVGGLVICSVPEVPLVDLCHLLKLLGSMFVLADGGMLSEEIITMEHKITI